MVAGRQIHIHFRPTSKPPQFLPVPSLFHCYCLCLPCFSFVHPAHSHPSSCMWIPHPAMNAMLRKLGAPGYGFKACTQREAQQPGDAAPLRHQAGGCESPPACCAAAQRALLPLVLAAGNPVVHGRCRCRCCSQGLRQRCRQARRSRPQRALDGMLAAANDTNAPPCVLHSKPGWATLCPKRMQQQHVSGSGAAARPWPAATWGGSQGRALCCEAAFASPDVLDALCSRQLGASEWRQPWRALRPSRRLHGP